MATRSVNVDCNTPKLLRPDLREWVSDESIVRLVMEAVAGMELAIVKIDRRSCGSKQSPPRMTLHLLIQCDANDIYSSRRSGRARDCDTAVRLRTADAHPDHDSICTFRRERFEALMASFLMLQRARTLGVLNVRTVGVDATHINIHAENEAIHRESAHAVRRGGRRAG